MTSNLWPLEIVLGLQSAAAIVIYLMLIFGPKDQ